MTPGTALLISACSSAFDGWCSASGEMTEWRETRDSGAADKATIQRVRETEEKEPDTQNRQMFLFNPEWRHA